MADLSDETLTFIVNRAKSIHHGEIRVILNADSPKQVSIEVIEKARFTTDDQIPTVERLPKPLRGGVDRPESPRRG